MINKKRAVGFEIRILSNLIKRRIESMTAAEEADITAMQGWILGYLYENEDKNIYQKDIEERFSIRRSTGTNLLQLMEKRELIKRQSVKEDARLKKIIPTQKSLAIHQRMRKRLGRFEEELLKGVTKEEIQQLYLTIDKLKQNIQ